MIAVILFMLLALQVQAAPSQTANTPSEVAATKNESRTAHDANAQTLMIIKKPFYFIRHGQTDHNLHRKCAGGGTDCPLNETGIKQAQQLKPTLSTINFDAVIASPMLRVHQTVEHALGIKPHHVYEDLREHILGKQFEGGPWEALDEYSAGLPDDEPIIGGGESLTQFRTRVISCLNEILNNHSGNILIVAHGRVGSVIANAIDIHLAHTKNAIPYYFQHDGEAWTLTEVPLLKENQKTTNDTSHTDQ